MTTTTTTALPRRRFGRTELAMPILSCGGMRYMHKWQDRPLADIPDESQRNVEATIHAALAHGVSHIETARGYGSSERQLGQLLPKLPRSELILQTKIAPTKDPRSFVDNFHDSLARLGVSHVDLLGLHGLNDEQSLEWAIRPGGCFDAAQELRNAGKTRFVGFSTHARLDLILRAIAHGEPEVGRGFDYVNLHWYFILQKNWPAIVAATERDMGVFIISPSDKGGHLYRPPQRLQKLCEPLSPMLFNDLFCLSHPEIHTLSVGAARPSDFDEHVKVAPLLLHAEATLAPIVEKLRARMREATGHESPEFVAEQLPEWERVPSGLNVKIMVWLRALALGWDLTEYGKARLNLLGNGDHWFPGAKPEAVHSVTKAELRNVVGPVLDEHGVYEQLLEVTELLRGSATKRESQ